MSTKNISEPLVSILMVTYNHAPYIKQAIESVLIQKTSFPFKLVVCDDASTDGTADIIEKLSKENDNLIFLRQPVNGRGVNNFLDGFNSLRTKYVAFCEGDDYWTSPNKLEKQVLFLEENPDFSVCCHKVEMQFDNLPKNRKKQYIYKDLSSDEERIQQGIFYADEVIANYYFQTSSMVFRWRFPNGLPPWFRRWMMFDHAMLMLHATEGKTKYFDEPMSVWRRNETGYSWLQNIDKGIFFQKEGIGWIKHYEEMNHFFSGRFYLQIRERILLALRNMVTNSLETGDLTKAKKIIFENKDWCHDLIKENINLFKAFQLSYPEKISRTPPWSTDEKIIKSSSKNTTIGGFKELDIAIIPECKDSVWHYWTKGQEYATFANPTAALISWLHHRRVRTLWLPATVHPSLLNELNELWIQYRLYHVNAELTPSIDFLSHTQPGDAVLTCCWAGRPPSEEIRNTLKSREGVFWIDDRTNALWTNTSYEADVTIYSPSEILGVPDGGILIGSGVSKINHSSGKNTLAPLRLQLLLDRLENPVLNTDQLLEEQAIHTTHPLPAGEMSRLTRSMLTRIPLPQIKARCQKNWHALYKSLEAYVIWKDLLNVEFAPSAFPILVPPSIPISFFLTALKRKDIICKGADFFNVDTNGAIGVQMELKRRLLYLPCDHRYDEKDMQKISEEVLKIIQGKSDLGISGSRFNP